MSVEANLPLGKRLRVIGEAALQTRGIEIGPAGLGHVRAFGGDLLRGLRARADDGDMA